METQWIFSKREEKMESLIARMFGLPPNWMEAGPAVIFGVAVTIAMILTISACLAIGALAYFTRKKAL